MLLHRTLPSPAGHSEALQGLQNLMVAADPLVPSGQQTINFLHARLHS